MASDAGIARIQAAAKLQSGKKEKATGTMPIIAMTAHAMKGDQEICLQAGMDGYITKPIQPSRLFQTIEEIASAHSAAAV